MNKRLTDEQVLKKCVEIALDDGWDRENGSYWRARVKVNEMLPHNPLMPSDYADIIFSHPFAKVLFGDETPVLLRGMKGATKKKMYLAGLLAWQYHLQMMVLAEDPISYLRDWLETSEGKERKGKR